ncbi:N-methyl-L-tryptophan oxidase [Paracraurococcus ruber]|uniref:N-methyltryptophan oxidase n=1 Tax=Paracraurococcus ruber TaxID=77675 RepID=A0ABS1D3R3_9PROT|nr:N-methyl-L-tryptophan oxidase [Paracraurococcus ruber]MBK1661434.1 N-methyltryptophan oxidase [Paracraurococcus ruber]TDG30176.1 N-methyl-L-tryptophan oxidase [Paracraurococcus ruber]
MAYDVIVVGIGGMGSATAWQLARRGQRVLGLERFDIPHAMGSSHGVTRIIRLPYYEDPAYVPLLHRAYALWRELEAATGERVLHTHGSLDGGLEDGVVFNGAIESARLHDLTHEVLTGEQVNARFPGYAMPAGMRFVLQPQGGYVMSERAIVAHVRAAQAAGAEIHARERVLGWEARAGGEGVVVTTDRGRYEAARLVLTAGAWMADLAPLLQGLAVPERQVLAWLQPQKPELFTPERFPVFNLEAAEGRYYGFPVVEVPGFKFGRYNHRQERMPAEAMNREVEAEDEAILRAFANRYFPHGTGPTMALRACLFTNTPDEHFVLDHHPAHRQVVVASPCSGHGYKFCSVIGEILADLATRDGTTPHDIGFLRLGRW